MSAATTPTHTASWCEWCDLTGTSNGKSSYNMHPGTSTSFRVSYRNTGNVSEIADVYTTGGYASVSRTSIYLPGPRHRRPEYPHRRHPRRGPARIHCTVTITVPKDAPIGTVTDSVTAQVTDGWFGIPDGPPVTFRFKVNVTAAPVYGITGTSNGAPSYKMHAHSTTTFPVVYRNTGNVPETATLKVSGSYATVSPSSISLPVGAQINPTVTITVPEGAPAGTVADSVAAQVAGGPSTVVNFTVNVAAAPVVPTVTCTSNGASSYNMQAEGNPSTSFMISCTKTGSASMTAAFTVSGSYATISPASISVPGSATVTIAVPSTAPGGTVTDTVNATARSGSSSVSAGSFSFKLNVTATPAPTLTVTPSSLSLLAGGSGSVSWTDANGSVELSGPASGWLRPGPPPSCPAFSCEGSYTVTVPSGTQPGNYTATLTNDGLNGTSISKTLIITVTAPAPASSLTPSSMTLRPGQSAGFTFTASNIRLAGGAGYFSESGSGSAYSWVYGPGNTPIWNTTGLTYSPTVTVPAETADGSYTITMTAWGSLGTVSKTLAITITAPVPAPTLTISPSSLTLAAGASGSVSLTATNSSSVTHSGSAAGWLSSEPSGPGCAPSSTCQAFKVTVPANTPSGNDTVTFTATGAGGVASGILTVAVPPPVKVVPTATVTVPGAYSGVGPQTGPTVAAGSTVPFSVTVKNTSTVPENAVETLTTGWPQYFTPNWNAGYTASGGWTTTGSDGTAQVTAPVPAGQSFTFRGTVAVSSSTPASALPSGGYEFLVIVNTVYYNLTAPSWSFANVTPSEDTILASVTGRAITR